MSPMEGIVGAVAVLTVITLLVALVRKGGRTIRRLAHFIDDVSGEEARPGVKARPGVVEQLAKVVETQRTEAVEREQIRQIARKAADDVAEVRNQLTTNGGTGTTKDMLQNTQASAEKAVRLARAAYAAASQSVALQRRHLANGEQIMEVGVHNDGIVHDELRKHGIEINDSMLKPYPAVDTGADLPELPVIDE